MRHELPVEGGGVVSFECAPDLASRWVHGDILAGKTYPHLPFVEDVEIIFDVGANCGSTSIHFARHHPEAVIHAFEPGSEQRAYLERNVSDLPNVQVHAIGLGDHDDEAPLYFGDGNTGLASILRRPDNHDQSELVTVRAAGPWATEHGIDRIDILKVDVEGLEVAVLESLVALLPTVKVLYVEYDSRQDRRAIERLLRPTHELFRGLAFLDQGELVFLRGDLADHPGVKARLLELFRGDPAPTP
jgi:FkbM family methyltransferase